MAARSRRSLFLLPLILVFVAATLSAQPAPAVGTCVTPPEIVPTGDLTPGTMGTAWTVVQGRTPVSFDVEVLGTLTDALAPGKDLVIIETSGTVIDTTGGIAAGMSGSPVYVGGKLAGSVSYGFGGGDPRLGGMTPAEDLVGVVDYPDDPLATLKVQLSDSERRLVARAAGTPLERVPGTLESITVPVAVSGLSARGIQLLQRQLEGKGANVHLYASGSTAAPEPALPPPALAAGESLAAVTSYGDLTFGGIGTVTAVCGDQVIGWGHPFWREGRTHMGMAAADIITVVTDPSDVWGPFKVGNIAEGHGIIDQDRLSAIRGVEGMYPVTIPITSHFTSDDTGVTRNGQTDVVMTKYLPDLAAFHMYGNLDVVADWTGEGSSVLDWQIDGTDENGAPFTLNYSDIYYGSWDFAYSSIDAFYYQLARLTSFDNVEITSAHMNGTATPDPLRAEITRLEVATPSNPSYKKRDSLKAKPGTKLMLRVFLNPAVGADYTVDISYKIPKSARGQGPLVVSGGENESYSYYYYAPKTRRSNSVADYLDELANETKASDIIVSLFPERREALDEDHYSQDTRVSGEEGFQLTLAT